MRWWVIAVVIAGCTAPGDAPGGDGPTSNGTPSTNPEGRDCGHIYAGEGTTGGGGTSPPAPRACQCPYRDGCPVPGVDTEPDIVFDLAASYPAGGTLVLDVTNQAQRDYVYQAAVVHCQVDLYTDAGRLVWPGPCYTDAISYPRIEPGSETIGERRLVECTRGNWGSFAGRCEESVPLPAGTYRLRHTFCAASDDYGEDCGAAEVRAGATFQVA